MPWAVNKCGGRRWRTHRNWLVEVEGAGIPMVTEADPRFAYMMQTWQHWGRYIEAAAKENHIPASWLLALASIETGFMSSNPEKQRKAISPAGAIGVMQIMPGTGRMYGYQPAELTDPRASFDVAGRFVSDLARGRTGPELPHIGSAYNGGPGSGSGGVRCSPGRNIWNMVADHDYPGQAIEFNNAAIHYLEVNQGSLGWAVALGGAMFALAAGVVAYTYVPKVRQWI